jgi:predicted amidohydrolase
MLRKIGFFHFGVKDKSEPIESLRASLVAASREDWLSDCLIVTPEAFNIRCGYWDDPPGRPDASIANSLKAVSADLRVAFVAGLIDESDGQNPGYSSAYLIDGDVCERLTRKLKPDRSPNYTPCPETYDHRRLHRGVCVAALICIDANFDEEEKRHVSICEPTGACDSDCSVLCVPACFAFHGT